MSSVPKKIGRYEIEGRLGRGGMGEVFVGRDSVGNRKVAVKVLRPERLDPDGGTREEDRKQFIEGFIDEARKLIRLEGHDNILTVYEIDMHEGAPFIAMQLLDGQTLKQVIEDADGGIVHPVTQRSIIGGIGNALEFAHEQGIYHCDIKPANIMLDSLGRSFLMDFGISRAVGRNLGAKQRQALRVHAALREPRAGRGQRTRGRDRHLQPRRRALRDVHGSSAAAKTAATRTRW